MIESSLWSPTFSTDKPIVSYSNPLRAEWPA